MSTPLSEDRAILNFPDQWSQLATQCSPEQLSELEQKAQTQSQQVVLLVNYLAARKSSSHQDAMVFATGHLDRLHETLESC